MLAFALRRIYRIPAGLICVRRGGERLGLSDTGVLRKLLFPMIRGSETVVAEVAISQKESRRLSELRFLGRKRERRRDSSPIRPLRLSRWGPEGAAGEWRRGANAANLRAEKLHARRLIPTGRF